ncbi:uncharacterized protein LOC128682081 [Plodia interpunctella]|uniref:uncharacterized protein LOC128682081 n=1 Tax=Plodia interpunctella TaxID=58824 RepID=UPI002367E708|nr:uncharacterized protein LOC128682081 [Plodia interpunctella]
MSTIEKPHNVWSVCTEGVNSKHEKCRNITEEIYKRINITFQIKKLETAVQSDISDQSDQIDSNELSNETDLFACDKSSISSTDVEQDRSMERVEKYININNNEEPSKKPPVVQKRPKKRFRKRVKKRQATAARESDGSSDEAVPLSRMVDIDSKADDEAGVMGVPNIIIVTKDLKAETVKKEKDFPCKKIATPKLEVESEPNIQPVVVLETIDKETTINKQCPTAEKQSPTKVMQTWEWKSCTMCGTLFRGERGLRRHMAMTHKIY